MLLGARRLNSVKRRRLTQTPYNGSMAAQAVVPC